jgi:polyketide cyclase/dehydrase/lipid transport protein
MTQHSFSASALIDAPAAKVYGIIADYRGGHQQILPKPYFVSMQVEQGGRGAGTVISFQMKLMGSLQSFHSIITEPEPGRVLVESETKRGAVTTFRVEPREDGKKSYATISTETPVPDGLPGKVQGWMTEQLLKPIYVKELEQLRKVATR